ncbi:GNAT family N-acetyltransferase [Streptomyces sp. NPDC048484]|uniref:GNAT family N-acetyltransferase n=1 Tax=Streptomyces sp. NPDC048484 TaxID=3155146 RepID=UPI003430DE41
MRTELCTDEREFGRLAEEWGLLYRRCGTATPFQSHAWLHSWWLSYGTPDRLRLMLVRDGGDLVAAAPLMLVRQPWPALVPLGGPISDFGDVLIEDGERADRAAGALADVLAAAARTALIDFREVRPGGAVERVYASWRGPRRRVPDSLCLELPALPMDDLIGRLATAKAQQRVRAKLRKLSTLGVERRAVRPDEVDAALRRLLELHRLQWQGRKVTTEHLQDRFAEHLIRSVGPMVRAGDAVVTEFRLDDTVVAVDLTLLSEQLAGGYLYGAHPQLRMRKADVATMLLHACAQHTGTGGSGTGGDGTGGGGTGGSGTSGGGAGGRRVLSLLRGNEPYKHHWRPQPVVNQRFLLARRRTAPLLSAAVCDVAARSRGKMLLDRFLSWRERGGGRP